MKYSYVFFSIVFLLHIINTVFPSNIMTFSLGILACLVFVYSFIYANKLFKLLGASFFLIGFTLFWTTDLTFMQLIPMFADNLSMLTLLAVLPWMNSAVTAARFDKLMQNLLRGNVQHLGALYQRSTTAMMALTAFLNVSSATIAQDVLVDNLKPIQKKLANKFIMMITLRGYSLALPWSPLEVLLAMAIFITGVNYGTLLPWMIFITIIMYILDNAWGRWYFKKIPYPVQPDVHVSHKPIKKKLVQLISGLVGFLLCVILAGLFFEMEFIFIVTILVFPFATIWAFLLKRLRSYWTIGWNKWRNSMNGMHNFNVLFVTLAIFTGCLNASPALQFIQKPILYVADYPFLILMMIQLLFMVMSMFGVHPIATMGVLSGISAMLIDILNPLSLAIVLVIAGVSTVPVGTYGLVVTITSMSLRQSPYLITYYNLLYSFVFGFVGILIAYLLL